MGKAEQPYCSEGDKEDEAVAGEISLLRSKPLNERYGLLATVDFRQSIQAIQTVVRTIRLPLPKISSVARLPRKIV
jgi:hypothetical protein